MPFGKAVAGNQRRPTAKIAARSSPNQKLGTACPKVAPRVAILSASELLERYGANLGISRKVERFISAETPA